MLCVSPARNDVIPESEVRRYAEVFWRRHGEFAEWQTYLRKVEKGDKRAGRRDSMKSEMMLQLPSVKLLFQVLILSIIPTFLLMDELVSLISLFYLFSLMTCHCFL